MSELRTITRHALTVLAGQLATMAYGVTDTLVAGRYSEASLAAFSIGSAIYISVFIGLMGVLQALLPIWAELHGAKDHAWLGHSFRQSFYLWLVLSVAGIAILLAPGPLMDWAEVPKALRSEVGNYLRVLALALPLALLLRLYATLNQSLGHPRLVTWLQLGSIALKAPLSIWLALGDGWGLGLGSVGCAWATFIAQAVLVLIALWLLATQGLYKPYRLWRRPDRSDWPDWPALKAFLRLGIPSGVSVLVEVTSFTLMALFVARLGVTASAAHQIAANLAGVLYMAPLSIGIAGSARASYWLGAGQPAQARHAVRASMALTTVCSILTAGALALFRHQVAAFYAPGAEAATLAATLLACVAGYHLFDAQQCVSIFLLRCWRITVAPMLIYGVLLWGLGLYGGYLLAYEGLNFQGLGMLPAMQSPAAFWLGGGAALALAALAFHAMLWRTTPRP